MVKTFVLYCKNNKDEIDLIFKMLCVFSLRTSNDFQFLRKFYQYYIPQNYSPVQKRRLFNHFLQFIKLDHVSQEVKINASQILIYPFLISTFKAGQAYEMMDQPTIDRFSRLITQEAEKSTLSHENINKLDVEIL